MKWLLAAFILIVGAGCTKGVPQFEELTAESGAVTINADAKVTQGGTTATSTSFKVEANVKSKSTPESTSTNLRSTR